MRAGSVYGRTDSIYRQPVSSYSRSGFTQPVYRSPAQGYRTSAGNYRSQGFGQRTSFAGAYSGKANRSGGFHLFGGGHSSKGFSGGSHKANFGGGHGLFGGHSGGHFGSHGGGGGIPMVITTRAKDCLVSDAVNVLQYHRIVASSLPFVPRSHRRPSSLCWSPN